MKSFLAILLTVFFSTALFAQSTCIQINPNGTHSVIHRHNKNVAVQVNPNGTHSVIHRHK